MTAKEWLRLMQQAADYNPKMTKLIEKYGEMLMNEEVERRIQERLPSRDMIIAETKEHYGLNYEKDRYHRGCAFMHGAYSVIDRVNFPRLTALINEHYVERQPQLTAEGAEEIYAVIEKRIERFFHIYQSYEAKELITALEIIKRLIPPGDFATLTADKIVEGKLKKTCQACDNTTLKELHCSACGNNFPI